MFSAGVFVTGAAGSGGPGVWGEEAYTCQWDRAAIGSLFCFVVVCLSLCLGSLLNVVRMSCCRSAEVFVVIVGSVGILLISRCFVVYRSVMSGW